MVEFVLNPGRTALINVDMQNCFVHGYPISAPDGLVVLERINTVTAACRRAGVLVIHTRFVVRPDGSNIGVMGEILPHVKEGTLDMGAESATLHQDLIVGPADVILDKPRFGAFHGTDLELILRSRGIDTVIVSGIATNVCCETTAREANVRDFRVMFLSDGTATFGLEDLTAQQLQKATCATLGAVFAQVLSVRDVLARLEQTMTPSVSAGG